MKNFIEWRTIIVRSIAFISLCLSSFYLQGSDFGYAIAANTIDDLYVSFDFSKTKLTYDGKQYSQAFIKMRKASEKSICRNCDYINVSTLASPDDFGIFITLAAPFTMLCKISNHPLVIKERLIEMLKNFKKGDTALVSYSTDTVPQNIDTLRQDVQNLVTEHFPITIEFSEKKIPLWERYSPIFARL